MCACVPGLNLKERGKGVDCNRYLHDSRADFQGWIEEIVCDDKGGVVLGISMKHDFERHWIQS